MIRNAWHISGGEGWAANSTCRRVLVTHTDGRQTVEEIKNDLGVGSDTASLLRALQRQGVDAVEIKSFGSVDTTRGAPVTGRPPASLADGSPARPKQTPTPATPPQQQQQATPQRGRHRGAGPSSIVFG
jgi:hypothetical protein